MNQSAVLLAGAATAAAVPLVRKMLRSVPIVNEDGSEVAIHNEWLNAPPTVMSMTFVQVCHFMHRYRSVVMQAVQRQRLALDRGENALLQVINAAPTPADVRAMRDPINGDLLLTFQFTDQPPISFRLGEWPARKMLNNAMRAIMAH